MDPWKNGVSVLPVRLGLKKLWCREALAVYVKGSGGCGGRANPRKSPEAPMAGPPAELQDTAASWEPERRREALSGGSLLQSEKGGLSGAGGHKGRPGRGDIFHRLFRGL